MLQIVDKSECCGCTACASICPHDAISMLPDELGFKYPNIDLLKCTNCGLCERVCSFNREYDTHLNLKEPIICGVRHKDIHQVEKSQSGAAYIPFTDWIINKGGIIYGVGYEKHFVVTHKRAINGKERDEFRGSKYVQSDLIGIFRLIRRDLKDGKIVCFSGTPCQTAGLNSFIGEKLRKNLYLVDIICHGVPSPLIWAENLKYLENKEKSEIVSVNFRDKKIAGWHSHIESYNFSNGKKLVSRIYTDIFYSHIAFRESCYKCYYANKTRPSDITIADFWGIEKYDKNFASDEKGCSVLFLNTDKGKYWFDEIKDSFNVLSGIENYEQPNLVKPSQMNPKRYSFEYDYKLLGYESIIHKYSFVGYRNTIKEMSKGIKKALQLIHRKIKLV